MIKLWIERAKVYNYMGNLVYADYCRTKAYIERQKLESRKAVEL